MKSLLPNYPIFNSKTTNKKLTFVGHVTPFRTTISALDVFFWKQFFLSNNSYKLIFYNLLYAFEWRLWQLFYLFYNLFSVNNLILPIFRLSFINFMLLTLDVF